MAICEQSLRNVNKTNCTELMGQVTGVFLDTINTTVPFADVKTEATWVAKIQAILAERMYMVIPKNAFDVVREVGEPIRTEGNTGILEEARKGRATYTFTITNLKDTYWEALKSFNGQNMYAWFYTEKNLLLSAHDATGVVPIPVQIFVDEVMTPETQDDFSKLNITVRITDTSNYFTSVKPLDFTIKEVNGIIDVTGTVTSASAATSTVIVEMKHRLDETEITSGFITAADFIIIDDVGAIQNPSGISNVGDLWSLTGVTIVNATDYSVYRKTTDVAIDKTYEWKEVDKVEFIGQA